MDEPPVALVEPYEECTPHVSVHSFNVAAWALNIYFGRVSTAAECVIQCPRDSQRQCGYDGASAHDGLPSGGIHVLAGPLHVVSMCTSYFCVKMCSFF
jgi:hypothetical protein